MRTAICTALLALALGPACFPVPVPVPVHHDYIAEHSDPSIVIYDHDPHDGHECWRHEEHWHCRR
ncbi:MAG TPA: hypothetical protein VEI82_06465 [Myxococcota bacterium]|nr:hypothetical protein [Myxococcota bacterium]